MHNKNYIKSLIFIILTFVFASSAYASTSINLNGKGAQIYVNDSNSLDGFNQATWNYWIKQNNYTSNAGVVGKYTPVTNGRSYLLRTSITDGTNVILSQDGINAISYTSYSGRHCGITAKDKWTMITVTYDKSTITYYKNGVKCDTDSTSISSIKNSISPVILGGGNNIYFSGGIDEFAIYNSSLDRNQIIRLYNESSYGSNKGPSIPVLVYHRIEDKSYDSIIVKPSEFAKQMSYLKANRFNTITLEDYYNWRKGSFNMPSKPIIVVFDDGWKTVYTEAKPVMDKNGFVGSLASVTNYAYGYSGGPSYMRWNEIKDLQNKGWSIESHGVSHSHMLDLSQSEFRKQLADSKKNIINMTGKTPHSFIFPFHESNSTWTSICAEYYTLCWTQGSLNPSYDFKSTVGNKYESLRRINIVNSTSIQQFAEYLEKDTNKAGEWKMDEGTGTKTADTSGNRNNGVLLNGASWSGTTAAKDCYDSDGGISYGTAGTADNRVNGIGTWYEDICLLKNQTGERSWEYVNVENCSGFNCNLQEGYCTSESVSNTAYLCSTGCSNGACQTSEDIARIALPVKDNIIEGDAGRAPSAMADLIEKKKWPDNMAIEEDRFYPHEKPKKIKKDKPDKEEKGAEKNRSDIEQVQTGINSTIEKVDKNENGTIKEIKNSIEEKIVKNITKIKKAIDKNEAKEEKKDKDQKKEDHKQKVKMLII